MLPEPQLSNRALVELCHRLSVETDSGIDIRRTWQREAEMASGRVKPHFEQVRDSVAKGESLSKALNRTGTLLPPLFLEMAHVGEQSGTLGRVMKRLEGHYRHQVQAQRAFLGAVAWPLIELGLAILVIGLLIWVLGELPARGGGRPIDILGFGLVGTKGLLIYFSIIFALALGVAGVVLAIKRGKLWTRPLQHSAMRIPVVGPALEKIALARLSWALHLMLNVEMDLRKLVPLALRTTGNDHYTQHTDRIVADIGRGEPIHVAFSRTHAFPAEFVDALTVAEESGRIVESMERLSNRYEEEAESAVKTLSVALGWAIGVCVMGIIVFLIFRLAGVYFGALGDALKMTK